MPFSAPLKVRRVPEEAVFGTEYLFRTGKACFLHRMPLMMRRVPQEAFLSTARIFRTPVGPLRYRVLRGKLLPLRNFELHNRGGLGTFTRYGTFVLDEQKKEVLVDLFLSL